MPAPPVEWAGCALPPRASAPLTNALTSALVMRFLREVPVTFAKSTPNSRARRRTDGLACDGPEFVCAACCTGVSFVGVWGVGTVGADVGAALGAAVTVSVAGVVTALGDAVTVSDVLFNTTMTSPSLTRSPTDTEIDLMVPACELGTSIDALSDSTVINGWSASTLSPMLTSNSMTSTSFAPPRSGIIISNSAGVAWVASVGATFAGSEGGVSMVLAVFSGELFASGLPDILNTTSPSETLSPTWMTISSMVPDDGAGMSIDALSDSTVINGSSVLMLSPILTRISMTSTASAPPKSGTLISFIIVLSSCVFFNSCAWFALSWSKSRDAWLSASPFFWVEFVVFFWVFRFWGELFFLTGGCLVSLGVLFAAEASLSGVFVSGSFTGWGFRVSSTMVSSTNKLLSLWITSSIPTMISFIFPALLAKTSAFLPWASTSKSAEPTSTLSPSVTRTRTILPLWKVMSGFGASSIYLIIDQCRLFFYWVNTICI